MAHKPTSLMLDEVDLRRLDRLAELLSSATGVHASRSAVARRAIAEGLDVIEASYELTTDEQDQAVTGDGHTAQEHEG